jgi:hypothetical protein
MSASKRPRALIATLGLVWVGALMAQPVYKWVDAQGQTHYGSQLPPQQADAQVAVSPNGSSGAGAGRFGEGPRHAIPTALGSCPRALRKWPTVWPRA